VKTARYARTGEWQEEMMWGAGGAREDDDDGLDTPTSSSGGSLRSSDCPEEVGRPDVPGASTGACLWVPPPMHVCQRCTYICELLIPCACAHAHARICI
jgi:hypothetical protein